MSRILVADDEENLRLILRSILEEAGHEVETVCDGQSALDHAQTTETDFVFLDIRMPKVDGLRVCQQLKEKNYPATIIVMSAFGSIDVAIEAMHAGAYDYISKPFKKDEVLLAVQKAEEREALRRADQRWQRMQKKHATGLLGQSKAIQKLQATIEQVASFDSTVLLEGESGTGKALVAKAVHEASARRDEVFLSVDCASLPEQLIESELFGHRKGAFTDAQQDHQGVFERANNGTLFLEQIQELDLRVQAKLLRAIEQREVRPIGGRENLPFNVRIIASCQGKLKEWVDEGLFREDLFYRLFVLPVSVPALRERRRDIPVLFESFLRTHAPLDAQVRALSSMAERRLLQHSWPGNLVELENLAEKVSVLSDCVLIDEPTIVKHLQASILERGQDERKEFSLKVAQKNLEIRMIQQALKKTAGNRTAAAKLLEISHRSLLYKLKEYEIS